MDLFERIELRRFVGREWLLWLWFESEIFETTLSTREHGSFGLWLSGRLLLSAGKETTAIKGTEPGRHRDAKEALLRGKLPELASVHLAWADHQATFTLKADSLGIVGLRLPKKEPAGSGDAPGAVAALTGSVASDRKRRPKGAARGADDAKAFAVHEDHEKFYERMHFARDIESILEALYRDFLTLRLGPAWSGAIAPLLAEWAEGVTLDGDTYARARAKALALRPSKGGRS